MTVPSVRLLAAAAWELLDGHASLTAYRSLVDPQPPVDESGTVEGYAVFQPGGGGTDRASLDAQPGQRLWTFQVMCVGGDHDYVTWVVDAVTALIDGHRLTVAGADVGLMQPPLGFRAPPAYRDPDARPPRLLLPLQYEVLAVATT